MAAWAMVTRNSRKGRLLLASLCLLSSLAIAQQDRALTARLDEIREVVRFVPPKAIESLLQIEQQARAADLRTRGEFLFQFSQARGNTGDVPAALLLADELLKLGHDNKDNDLIAHGLLARSYCAFRLNDQKGSHILAWEAEKMAASSTSIPLKIRVTIASADSYSEEGNFPAALQKLQTAVQLARQSGQPIQQAMAFNSLAVLYWHMKEYGKGFEAFAEATVAAEKINSPGRLSLLKSTEYALSIENNQPERGLRALLAGLAYQRQIGAEAMIASSLVNLSDSYLKQKNYRKALEYATQAGETARRIKNESAEATARINTGEAYLGMGKLVEGKRHVEAGLPFYEKSGDKVEMQKLMLEYGAYLERAGDTAGAIKDYHRERKLSSELFEKRRQKATWELQEKYEAEKRERRIELLSRENLIKSTEIENRRLQQRVWWLLVFVFGLVTAGLCGLTGS